MEKKAKARLPSSGSKLRWEREGAENTLRGERKPKTDKASDNAEAKKAQRKQIQKEAANQKKKKSAKKSGFACFLREIMVLLQTSYDKLYMQASYDKLYMQTSYNML